MERAEWYAESESESGWGGKAEEEPAGLEGGLAGLSGPKRSKRGGLCLGDGEAGEATCVVTQRKETMICCKCTFQCPWCPLSECSELSMANLVGRLWRPRSLVISVMSLPMVVTSCELQEPA